MSKSPGLNEITTTTLRNRSVPVRHKVLRNDPAGVTRTKTRPVVNVAKPGKNPYRKVNHR